jgi:hypothetical protein
MKKITKLLLFFTAFLFISAGSDSFSLPKFFVDPHDSLIFNGENYFRTETYYSKPGDECNFRVTYVKGNATGKIKKMMIYEDCGIDTVYEYVNGAIEKYSVIQGGEQVKTGPESNVKIELPDGSVIILGPNTEYTLPTNACDLSRSGTLNLGSIWTKVKKLIGGGKFEVSTERAVHGVRGTEFTVEIKEENGIKYDIVKVYEGTVDVMLTSLDTKEYENKGDEMQKITEDYQAGKITMEEYSKKIFEMGNAIQNETANLKISQLVESGYYLKVGKLLGDPMQFNTSEDNWFKINE